jgi:hypothetical protein
VTYFGPVIHGTRHLMKTCVLMLLVVATCAVLPRSARAQDTDTTAQRAEARSQEVKPEETKKAKKPRRNRRVITSEEIDEATSQGLVTAYDVVVRLRREWFRTRGETRASVVSEGNENATRAPVMFLNRTPLGEDPKALHEIQSAIVKEIRFHSGPEATIKFGAGYPYGVVQVITR